MNSNIVNVQQVIESVVQQPKDERVKILQVLCEQIRSESGSTFGQIFELACKLYLYDRISKDDDSRRLDELYDMCELAYECSKETICESNTVFLLIEEILDMLPIEACIGVFSYLESRISDFADKDIRGDRGQGLILLRSCNELLRRLSRAEDTVFCGRILIFLAKIFPLAERSGVNLRGEYNTTNVTFYDKDDVAMMNGGNAAEENKSAFYELFWAMQDFFRDPKSLYAPTRLAKFRISLEEVIRVFKEKEAQEKNTNSSRRKRKREDTASTTQQQFFSPKFLTSPSLLELELADSSFRLQVIFQSLIILDHLLASSSYQAETYAALPKQNQAVMNTWKPTTEEEHGLVQLRSDLKRIILESPRRESMPTATAVFDREKNWVYWKLDNCKPFDKPGLDKDAAVANALLNFNRFMSPLRPYRYAVGTATLSRLWKRSNDYSDLKPFQQLSNYTVPQPASFLPGVQTIDAELSEAAAQPDEIARLKELKASKTWRALRVASQSRLDVFGRIEGGDLEQYVKLTSTT